MDSLGAAGRHQFFDDGHRLFAVLMLDHEQKPASFTGCITGYTCPLRPWHAVRVVRSPKGRAARNLFFGRDRRLVVEIDCARAKCWQ